MYFSIWTVDIGIFLSPKNFHLFGSPSWKSSDPKIIGIKTDRFEKFQPEKRLLKILGDLFRVKIR